MMFVYVCIEYFVNDPATKMTPIYLNFENYVEAISFCRFLVLIFKLEMIQDDESVGFPRKCFAWKFLLDAGRMEERLGIIKKDLLRL